MGAATTGPAAPKPLSNNTADMAPDTAIRRIFTSHQPSPTVASVWITPASEQNLRQMQLKRQVLVSSESIVQTAASQPLDSSSSDGMPKPHRYPRSVADTKQTKTIGEHHVASELARRGWAPALTRDGLERTDLLAVQAEGASRRLVEVQVKTARAASWDAIRWVLGEKSQQPSEHGQEYFVLVAVPHDLAQHPRCFVVPRSHVAAAAWIQHMDWLTTPGIQPGKRNAPVGKSRPARAIFDGYEDRWDLLMIDEEDAPVLLPAGYRDLALEDRVGLPPGHRWHGSLPDPW